MFPLCNLGTKGAALLRGVAVKKEEEERPRGGTASTVCGIVVDGVVVLVRGVVAPWAGAEDDACGNLVECGAESAAAGAGLGKHCDHAIMHLDKGEKCRATAVATRVHVVHGTLSWCTRCIGSVDSNVCIRHCVA